MQLPGSAHDVAVEGYGFKFDYIDPQYPTAAKVEWSCMGLGAVLIRENSRIL